MNTFNLVNYCRTLKIKVKEIIVFSKVLFGCLYNIL